MSKKIYVIAETPGGAAELKTGAAGFGDTVAVLACEDLQDHSFISYIGGMIEEIRSAEPELVLVEATRNGRLAAAQIAAVLGTSVLTDPSELKEEDGVLVSRRVVYGGAAVKTEKALTGTTVVCAGAGMFTADPAAEAEEIVLPAGEGVQFVERRKKEGTTVNLAAAKVIVGVGRGLGKEENMQLARDLASAIGGEVGCSRPVAEEEHWLPEDQYIGISGVKIKPDVYIACGISGQIQHLAGCTDAKLLIAVNKDENAAIFENCDYGIVGDLEKVIPALTERLQA